MSEQMIIEAIQNKKMLCPKCKSPVQRYEKYAETVDSVRDGFNIQEISSQASRVTLHCGNGDCNWKERTEYWETYIIED